MIGVGELGELSRQLAWRVNQYLLRCDVPGVVEVPEDQRRVDARSAFSDRFEPVREIRHPHPSLGDSPWLRPAATARNSSPVATLLESQTVMSPVVSRMAWPYMIVAGSRFGCRSRVHGCDLLTGSA